MAIVRSDSLFRASRLSRRFFAKLSTMLILPLIVIVVVVVVVVVGMLLSLIMQRKRVIDWQTSTSWRMMRPRRVVFLDPPVPLSPLKHRRRHRRTRSHEIAVTSRTDECRRSNDAAQGAQLCRVRVAKESHGENFVSEVPLLEEEGRRRRSLSRKTIGGQGQTRPESTTSKGHLPGVLAQRSQTSSTPIIQKDRQTHWFSPVSITCKPASSTTARPSSAL